MEPAPGAYRRVAHSTRATGLRARNRSLSRDRSAASGGPITSIRRRFSITFAPGCEPSRAPGRVTHAKIRVVPARRQESIGAMDSRSENDPRAVDDVPRRPGQTGADLEGHDQPGSGRMLQPRARGDVSTSRNVLAMTEPLPRESGEPWSRRLNGSAGHPGTRSRPRWCGATATEGCWSGERCGGCSRSGVAGMSASCYITVRIVVRR